MIVRSTQSIVTVLVIALMWSPLPVRADFIFEHFHDTTGLRFNGHAITSSCANASKFAYGDVHSSNREMFNHVVTDAQFTETTTVVGRTETETNPHGETNDVHGRVGHRDDFEHEPLSECPVRVRLTPSEPDRTGSMWYTEELEILSGFECGFRFQITDLSRECNFVKDRSFGTKQYKACAVHGGDGFAFVVHGSSSGLDSIGEGADGMGYDGLVNSMAVEFDTWYNPERGDLFADHVSVHSGGPRRPNNAGQTTQLGLAKEHALADGQPHVARVRYFPEIRYEYVSQFTATSEMLEYIKDNEEGRRVGTLAVFVDDNTSPLLAMPINLSILLALKEGNAYVGFTAATGRSWEKHDIVAWYCCEEPPCLHADTIGMDHHDSRMDRANDDDKLDFHQASRDNGAIVRETPDMSTPADPTHIAR